MMIRLAAEKFIPLGVAVSLMMMYEWYLRRKAFLSFQLGQETLPHSIGTKLAIQDGAIALRDQSFLPFLFSKKKKKKRHRYCTASLF